MEVLNFLVEDALILVPVFWFIGWMIKQSGKVDNAWIPFILTAISIAFVPWFLGDYSPANIVQSVLVVGISVLGDQFVKQGSNLMSNN